MNKVDRKKKKKDLEDEDMEVDEEEVDEFADDLMEKEIEKMNPEFFDEDDDFAD